MRTHQDARRNSKRLTFVRAYRANNLLAKHQSIKLYLENALIYHYQDKESR